MTHSGIFCIVWLKSVGFCLFSWFCFFNLMCVLIFSQPRPTSVHRETYVWHLEWLWTATTMHFSTDLEGNFPCCTEGRKEGMEEGRKEGMEEGRNGGRKEGRILPYPWLNKKPIRTNLSPINISQNGCTRSPKYRNTLHTGLNIAMFCDGGWRHEANEIDVHGLMPVILG